MFRSVTQLRLIFVKGVRSVSRFFFFFCMWGSHCSGTIVEKTIFCPPSCLCSFVRDHLLHLCGSISGLSILFRGSVCLFFDRYVIGEVL